jgi:hypothetical protein
LQIYKICNFKAKLHKNTKIIINKKMRSLNRKIKVTVTVIEWKHKTNTKVKVKITSIIIITFKENLRIKNKNKILLVIKSILNSKNNKEYVCY